MVFWPWAIWVEKYQFPTFTLCKAHYVLVLFWVLASSFSICSVLCNFILLFICRFIESGVEISIYFRLLTFYLLQLSLCLCYHFFSSQNIWMDYSCMHVFISTCHSEMNIPIRACRCTHAPTGATNMDAFMCECEPMSCIIQSWLVEFRFQVCIRGASERHTWLHRRRCCF